MESTDPGVAVAAPGVEVLSPVTADQARILTPAALAFVATLERAARLPREILLRRRAARQERIDAGELPNFLPETEAIRTSAWIAAAAPRDLQDRRVEITGPVDRKMIINALNSGANVFMADFEDATSPTWENIIQGQVNLRDAVRRQIELETADGKHYRLNDEIATLIVRPRGWHLIEKHVLVDGKPVSASVFDFALYLFHNAEELRWRGSGPYFYLPKLQSHLEARLWNDLSVLAQRELGIPRGTIRATVLIEHILAAFEMDEILWELREHAAGLNCGRWDYIFSTIKTFRNHPTFLMPDRALVTMTTHAMRSYTQLSIRTCHRRNVHAIGGMAAQIPIRNNPEANDEALARVRADKQREARDGHDGTWVAHPGLIAIAREEFDAVLTGPHQIDRKRDDVQVTAADLLTVPPGEITEQGLRANVRVGMRYLAAWFSGNGCVPINNLMEDAATAEICRSQLWQWARHGATLADGRTVTKQIVRSAIAEEGQRIRESIGAERFGAGRFDEATTILDALVGGDFVEFLTLPGYELLP
jgi:malate synthase